MLQAMQEIESSLGLNSSKTVKKKGASTALSTLSFCSFFESALVEKEAKATVEVTAAGVAAVMM